MKVFAILSILTLAFFANIPHSFAQDNSAPSNKILEISPLMPPPQPINGGMPPPQAKEPVPSITVPIEIPQIEALENEEPALDNHIIIETAPIETPVEGSVKPVMMEHSGFSRMKQLAGRWEGVGAGNASVDNQEKIAVVYEVTAGGHAVLEKIFPETAQEMITVYYEDKGHLNLMHFFMIGTRSMMALKPSMGDNGRVFDFELSNSSDLNPEVDTHMHSLKISFVDENRINQVWTMFEAGKLSGVYTFNLTRAPVID